MFIGKHPTPFDEIDFWNARQENLENILDQLRTAQIRTVVYVLEKLDSFCVSAFKIMFQNFITALHETRDITLHLNPLVLLLLLFYYFFFFLFTNIIFYFLFRTHTQRARIEELEMTDFEDARPLIKPLLHVICLIWSHSKYYPEYSGMLNLFRMINNMLIAESSKNLDGDSIFQGDVGESYSKVTQSINVLLYFK